MVDITIVHGVYKPTYNWGGTTLYDSGSNTGQRWLHPLLIVKALEALALQALPMLLFQAIAAQVLLDQHHWGFRHRPGASIYSRLLMITIVVPIIIVT